MKNALIEFKTIALPAGFDPVNFVTQAKEQGWNVASMSVERVDEGVVNFKTHNVGFSDPASEVKNLYSEGWALKAITIEKYWLDPKDEIQMERQSRAKEKGIWLPSR